jgi:hypothetical protein
MPGFPNVAAASEHLLARYDDLLLDAAPWAAGDTTDAPPSDSLTSAPSDRSESSGGSECSESREWPREAVPLHKALRALDGRHPLALGHFANHPPAGLRANVLVAPFDLALADGARPALRDPTIA